MQSFLDPEAPLVQIGDLNHVIYLAGIFIILFMLFKFRYQIKENPKTAMLGILIFAIVQRIISGSYYILADEFTVTDSLPLHICRLVCYLIIIQYFAERKWLDQIIFYFGLFAYASFIYPVGISPALHMLGLSFFMLHSLIIVYPIIRYFTSGFAPSLRGAFQSAILFAVYLTGMQLLNNAIGSNYFYTEERPFLHDLSEPVYFLLNMFGIGIGFVIVALLIHLVINYVKHKTEKPKNEKEKTLV
ncbi:TIGR02206 family membrane protein [Jeotgalicoccus nanhaiensis]|uniref:TIGR02206 family membrane protein n=1 Tax=Jeotgalicoccus nanhaiensis TaxID=568603 RepID=A0ABR9XW74_9STAP|nr:TIGR02206 family membrane protein [Jeotgalicoccus nanhaiensis]MBF0753214.1 TIGR02206 family membrane protein [Jeotgalicoccus nanhaiensis]TFU62384.1 TIGR02206 family membrane protein [Jeotgalicoccus nanhaiensis]